MQKQVIVAGVLGCIVIIVWGFVVNGLLGFKSGIDMNRLPDEQRVYKMLKETVVEPGRYSCDPEVTPGEGFPGDEPAFSILYSGIGHGAAGKLLVFEIVIFFLAPLIGAWLLSAASMRILSSYPRKVLFFTGIGLLFALFGDLMDFGIGGYPLPDAVKLAVHDVVLWTVLGLVVAWRIQPGRGSEQRVEA